MPGPYRIIMAKRAANDLMGVPATPAVLGEILNAIESLAQFPGRNVVPQQPLAKWPIRSLPVRPYMVYFRVDEARGDVTILRVRHGSRRPLRRFD
jgi:plasmid stabilization system protein ParE